jgi:enoyl-CoA hydratase
MLLLGEAIGADRMHSLGLVNFLAQPGEAVSEAMAVAARICSCAPSSVAESLRALEALVADEDTSGWQISEEALEAISRSADMQEGVAAFFEKRAPRWVGS